MVGWKKKIHEGCWITTLEFWGTCGALGWSRGLVELQKCRIFTNAWRLMEDATLRRICSANISCMVVTVFIREQVQGISLEVYESG